MGKNQGKEKERSMKENAGRARRKEKGFQGAALESARFLAAWVLVFLATYIFISIAIGFGPFEIFAANSSALLLNSFGAKTTVVLEEGSVFIIARGTRILISELCTGLFEVALVAAAIIASFGVPRRKRAAGVMGAVLFGFIFNAFRIFASAMQIITTGIEKAEFTHDILFRLSIILVVAIYYYYWAKWASGAWQKDSI